MPPPYPPAAQVPISLLRAPERLLAVPPPALALEVPAAPAGVMSSVIESVIGYYRRYSRPRTRGAAPGSALEPRRASPVPRRHKTLAAGGRIARQRGPGAGGRGVYLTETIRFGYKPVMDSESVIDLSMSGATSRPVIEKRMFRVFKSDSGTALRVQETHIRGEEIVVRTTTNARLGYMLLLALALLVSGCHATTNGWDRGAPRLSGGQSGAPVVVVPAEDLGRRIDHLGRRIPGAKR